MKIEVPDITTTDCGAIAITAAEGGIGYWAQIETYTPSAWDGIEVPACFGFYTIHEWDGEGYDEGDPIVITPDLIRLGYERMLSGNYCRSDLVGQALECLVGGEPDAVDSDVADCIVQLGAFGEVVYG